MEPLLRTLTALEQLRNFTQDVSVAMFSIIENDKITCRPMITQEVDDDGNIWFFSNQMLAHNHHQNITLIYALPDKNTYLCVDGTFSNDTHDVAKFRQFWKPGLETYFDNAEVSVNLIKVIVHEAAYWDSARAQMVTFYERNTPYSQPVVSSVLPHCES
jgi:general stress protein 26